MSPANLRLFLKSARNLRLRITTGINRALGREHIPAHPDCMYIETTSFCNLDCRFCAYPKKSSPKVTMDNEFFRDCIEQALDMGYERFDLTPCTGDVFMDKRIFEKLDYLEGNPRVRSYTFHTNFTVPDREDIDRLVSLRKISELHISAYGYSPESFVAFTQAPQKVYHRLVSNLEYLLRQTETLPWPLHIIFHKGSRSLKDETSSLIEVLEKLALAGARVKPNKGLYNNWGGLVTNEDVKDLPITVLGTDAIYKNGACVRLFNMVQITATGIVNGCACRDVNVTLPLGDLHQAPLKEIISPGNPAYMKLIDDQHNGDFPPICRDCDNYSSILHKSSSYRREGTRLQTLKAFRFCAPRNS